MTLADKLGQMTQHACQRHDGQEVQAAVHAGQIGSFLNARGREHRNQLQRWAVEETRLGIPLIFGRDVIHGYRTAFPIPLAQAASFDLESIEEAARIAAREAAEEGVDWTFAPMVDIARDPRWGRVAEGAGEDPFLTSAVGAAMVRGYQGEDPSEPERIAACAKHYVGYGASESGKDYNSTFIPEQLLREVYLAPFRACVRAGALTLMSGFNDLNGIPASGNELSLRQILKGEWAFSGFVVSDWASLREMIVHGYCVDEADVAEKSLRAGVDMEMASRCFLDHLSELLERSAVDIELVDDAVRRILLVKHRLGLFEHPYTEAPRESVALKGAHLRHAERLAERSIVLLKNAAEALPLAEDVRSIAVIGPLADDGHEQIGCWAFDAQREASVTVLSALRDRVKSETELHFAPGLGDARDTSEALFDDAVAAARRSEVSVLVLGENANISGEARSRAFLDLPGAQLRLIEEVAAVAPKVVLLIMAGRPLTIGRACELAHAVLYAWHPGTMAGPALAKLLFGDRSPSAKLPISFPRTVGQLPIYYGHKNTGRPAQRDFEGLPDGNPLDPRGMNSSYLDVQNSPQFPFGHGLSYTEFGFSNLAVSPTSCPVDGRLLVSLDVTNRGARAGTEVVQLYVRDHVGSITRPVRELKGFQRVSLAPGETRRVQFELPASTLAFPGQDMQPVVEPGQFSVFVGASSQAELRAEFSLR